jgi:hypothetical protein
MSTITLFRPRTVAYRARSFDVRVDGNLVGRLAASGRLELVLPPGRHAVTAHVGSRASAPFTIELDDAGGSRVLAVTVVETALPSGPARGDLLIDEVDELVDQPPAGARAVAIGGSGTLASRPRGEQLGYGIGIVLVVVGLIVQHAGSDTVGVLIGTPGVLILCVMLFRLLLQRRR